MCASYIYEMILIAHARYKEECIDSEQKLLNNFTADS